MGGHAAEAFVGELELAEVVDVGGACVGHGGESITKVVLSLQDTSIY
jgi:hypothetical protein